MKRTLLLCALVAAIAAAGSLYAWPRLGDTVPIHWGLGGEPDGYAPKAFGLFLLPGLAALVPAIIAGVTALDPRKAHVEQSMSALRLLMVGLTGFFAIVHAMVLHAMLGDGRLSEHGMFLAMGGLCIVIGAVLPGLRSNYFTGIRTPWTLQSERVWERTHRIGGVTLGAAGVVISAASFLLSSGWAIAVAMAALFLGSTIPVVMSYVYWKEERAAPR